MEGTRTASQKILQYLLEKPNSTKYAIERDTHLARDTVYRVLPNLEQQHLVNPVAEEERASYFGKRVAYYQLTVSGLFRALRDYFFSEFRATRKRPFIENVAKAYQSLLPEIFGEWQVFVQASKGKVWKYRSERGREWEGPSPEDLAISHLKLLVSHFPSLEYGWESEASGETWNERFEKEVHEEWKGLAMRLFIFGSDREDPSKVIWSEPWISTVASNPVLAKWAQRIAKRLGRRYANAQVRWGSIVEEFKTTSAAWD